ncbi:hypothetical protein Vretimale_5049 [Volvox reticuliferus]|uniref:Uncharacterized protein n=1 Tax=Volvox reticuliferus TaxID=1737510 RepID=A0A8J4DCM7_9CHLO|nr:hypothetical protein Vretimale_5049 [Volvox reticuliferus]
MRLRHGGPEPHIDCTHAPVVTVDGPTLPLTSSVVMPTLKLYSTVTVVTMQVSIKVLQSSPKSCSQVRDLVLQPSQLARTCASTPCNAFKFFGCAIVNANAPRNSTLMDGHVGATASTSTMLMPRSQSLKSTCVRVSIVVAVPYSCSCLREGTYC